MTKSSPLEATEEPNESAQNPDAPRSEFWRRFAFSGLRARLLVIILLSLLPAFLLLLGVAAFERRQALANATEDVLATARIVGDEYEQIIRSAEQLLTLAAYYPEVRDGNPTLCNQRLQQIFDTTQYAVKINVANAAGDVLCVVTPQQVTGTQNISLRHYFQQAMAQKHFVVGGLETGTFSHRPTLTFGYPVLDAAGAVENVIGYGLDVGELNHREDEGQFQENAVLVVTDQHGAIIQRTPGAEAYVGTHFDLEQLGIGSPFTEGVQSAVGVDDEKRLYGFTTVEVNELPVFRVLVGFADERIYGGIQRTLRASLWGLSLISLFALAAAWLSAENIIVNRINRIVAVADRMREGDLNARSGMQGDPSELGGLGATLDSLAARLQERQSENEQLINQMTLLNSDLEQRVVDRTRQLVKSNERLIASQAELRRLSHQLMRATEQERSRISREIHDQLGQALTAIKMELRSARRKLEPPAAAIDAPAESTAAYSAPAYSAESAARFAATKLDSSSQMVDEMVVLVRRIAADLRPGLLDDFGLGAAIEWQLQEFNKLSGVEYTLETNIDETRLTPNQTTAAFRILQESLTNVARHARATAVDVQVAMDESGLTLRLYDNGAGFASGVSNRPGSLGLLGMRERAVELGGNVDIASNPGEGTTVQLWLPLNNHGDAAPEPSAWAPP